MRIVGIKCREVMACAGSWADIAEAEVVNDAGEKVYVLVQEYDSMEYTVTKESLYSFLAEDGDEPNAEFAEEYTSWKDAQASAYAEVFKMLRGLLKKLG